jgi:hypothetical protein
VLPDDKNAVLRRRWCDGGAATLGLAAAAWLVALRQMDGMDIGVAIELGSLGYRRAASDGNRRPWNRHRSRAVVDSRSHVATGRRRAK